MSTHVFFFGGFKATQTDMNVWTGNASAQKPGVDFDAFPWPPGAGAGAKSAIGTFSKGGGLKSAADMIQSCGADEIFIVGHSSGCAIANAVDRSIANHDKIVLVALDGFAPHRDQLARPSTQVWAGECGKAKSLNHDNLKDAVGSRLQIFKATAAKGKWALHFSLVNSAASDRNVTSIGTGYVGCRSNLCWM